MTITNHILAGAVIGLAVTNPVVALIARRTVTIGTLNSSLIHPREIFAAPLKDRAASVVIAHNHPSGDVTPSKDDITVTQQLIVAGQILGITVCDHLIVTKDDSYSFRGSGLLFD